jgi:hypothetical protein
MGIETTAANAWYGAEIAGLNQAWLACSVLSRNPWGLARSSAVGNLVRECPARRLPAIF